MQFRSIQNRILVMAGIAMTAALVILPFGVAEAGAKLLQPSILAFGVVAYDLVTDRQRTEQAALDSARQQALVQSRAAAEMVQASLDRFDFALQTAREWRNDQGTMDVVWITHAGVARCVAWLQERGESALPRSEDWPVAAPGCGEWEIRELA